jgi:hypothetical protein
VTETPAGISARQAEKVRAQTRTQPPGLARRRDTLGSTSRGGERGRYFTLQQVADQYPVFTVRLLRRLVQERRIAFSRVGRFVVVAEADIEEYLDTNRVEPPARPRHWEVAS